MIYLGKPEGKGRLLPIAGLEATRRRGELPATPAVHRTETEHGEGHMLRIRNSALLVLVLAGAVARGSAAQFEISPRVGVHLDHGARPEWIRAYNITHLLSDDAWEANAKATVPLVGLRVGLAPHPRVRFEAEVLYSRNTHSEFLVFNPEVSASARSPDSMVTVSHVFASFKLGLSLTSPDAPLRIRVSAGPLWVRRSSSATILIDRTAAVGGSFGLSLVQRIGGSVGIGADALLNLYGNKYKQRSYPFGQGVRFTNRDVMFVAGLTLALGRKPGYGWDSGPRLAPRHGLVTPPE